jgi:hypothetical protein
VADTTIRSLAILRSRTMDRLDAVDVSNREEWGAQEKNWASRSWSRQCGGLANAMLSESPTSVPDVLSVLLVALEKFDADVIMEDDVRAGTRAERTCEQMRIVLANCAAALADIVPEPTRSEMDMIRVCRAMREQWLPATAVEAQGAEKAS